MGHIGEIRGIKIGNAQDSQGMTGITVVLCERGATAGVSVMGGAPGTRETDLLRPTFTVDTVHGVFLAGGSAFGLNAAEGVVRYLEEKGIGYDTDVLKVPIVSGAILFDLGLGDARARPDPGMAYLACTEAGTKKPQSGSFGAGTGATVGKLLGPQYMMKSGLGNCCISTAGGHKVGAILAVNAVGDVVHPGTGRILAGAFDRNKKQFVFEPARKELLGSSFMTNTTIGAVATDVYLSKEECSRVAIMAMAGMARVIRPCFTPYDGDTLFVLSTGETERPREKDRVTLVTQVGAAAQDAVAGAIVNAVTSCSGFPPIPAAKDLD